MPKYQYFSETADLRIEVSHSIHAAPRTWGELCGAAGLEPGDLDPATPVSREISGGTLLVHRPGGAGHHGSGGCCGVAGCG